MLLSSWGTHGWQLGCGWCSSWEQQPWAKLSYTSFENRFGVKLHIFGDAFQVIETRVTAWRRWSNWEQQPRFQCNWLSSNVERCPVMRHCDIVTLLFCIYTRCYFTLQIPWLDYRKESYWYDCGPWGNRSMNFEFCSHTILSLIPAPSVKTLPKAQRTQVIENFDPFTPYSSKKGSLILKGIGRSFNKLWNLG